MGGESNLEYIINPIYFYKNYKSNIKEQKVRFHSDDLRFLKTDDRTQFFMNYQGITNNFPYNNQEILSLMLGFDFEKIKFN